MKTTLHMMKTCFYYPIFASRHINIKYFILFYLVNHFIINVYFYCTISRNEKIESRPVYMLQNSQPIWLYFLIPKKISHVNWHSTWAGSDTISYNVLFIPRHSIVPQTDFIFVLIFHWSHLLFAVMAFVRYCPTISTMHVG